MVAIFSSCSFVFIELLCLSIKDTISFAAISIHLFIKTGLTQDSNALTHLDTIHLNIAIVDVVPSHASLFVFSAASLAIITHIFSYLSSSVICQATVTQSLVIVG